MEIEQPERRQKEHEPRLAPRLSEPSRERALIIPIAKEWFMNHKEFGFSPLSPLPRQALIEPSESTDRQTVWLELHPELWSVCFHLTLHMARLHSRLQVFSSPPSLRKACVTKRKEDKSLNEPKFISPDFPLYSSPFFPCGEDK